MVLPESDDWVEVHVEDGRSGRISLVMLEDERARGRLHLPLIDDQDRARLSGRRARGRRIEARDWLIALVGVLMVGASIATLILQIVSHP